MAQEAKLVLLVLVLGILGAVGYGVYSARHAEAPNLTLRTTWTRDDNYGTSGASGGTEVAKDDIPCFDSAESLERATSAIADQDPGGFAAEMATHGTHIVKGQRFSVVESKPPVEHVRAGGKDCYMLSGSNRASGP